MTRPITLRTVAAHRVSRCVELNPDSPLCPDCADLLFSGHTATYTLFALFWSHYSRGDDFRACGVHCEGVWLGQPDTDAVGDPSGWHWGKLVPWALFLLGVFFILSTRFHYSIDGQLTPLPSPQQLTQFFSHYLTCPLSLHCNLVSVHRFHTHHPSLPLVPLLRQGDVGAEDGGQCIHSMV